jgi:hypothetical protein
MNQDSEFTWWEPNLMKNLKRIALLQTCETDLWCWPGYDDHTKELPPTWNRVPRVETLEIGGFHKVRRHATKICRCAIVTFPSAVAFSLAIAVATAPDTIIAFSSAVGRRRCLLFSHPHR